MQRDVTTVMAQHLVSGCSTPELPGQLYEFARHYSYVLHILKTKFRERKVRQQPDELLRLAQHLQSCENRTAGLEFAGDLNMQEAIEKIEGAQRARTNNEFIKN